MFRAVSVVVLASALSCFADDWASVRNGPQQQGIAATKLGDQLELRWEISDEDGFITSPAIVDGKVFSAALSGTFRCLDLVDGREIWTAQTPADQSGFRPGYNSSPTVADDTVYVGDEDGTFYAYARADGQLKWKKVTDDQIVGGATVIGDRVLFGSHDGKLYCVSAATGDEHWSFLTDGPVNCSVAVASIGDRQVTFVAGCDELLRSIDVQTGEEIGSMPLGSPLIASPALRDGILYVGSYAGEFSAIDVAKMETVWKHEGDRSQPIHSSAAVAEQIAVVGGRDRTLRAFNRATGDVLWEVRTRSKIDASPVIVGERAIVGTGDKRILVVNLSDGEIAWDYAAGSPISTGAAVADGCVVVGTEGPRGKLFCFESAAK